MIDLEQISKEMDNNKTAPEVERRKERKQLFLDIVSVWETEQDIDYNIPISMLVKVLIESPEYIREMKEHADCIDAISASLDKCDYVAKIPRLL